MKSLIDDYKKYFDESIYNPLTNFEPEYNWQFKKTEPYKHYFYIFNNQIKNLPESQTERIDNIKSTIKTAISMFREIEDNVLLDDNSDGSHLPTWFNVINAFKKEINL